MLTSPACWLSTPPIAARMIGVPKRNENRAAAVCDSLQKSPAAMVTPDREVPGSSAIACAHPTNSACPRLNRRISPSSSVSFGAMRSAARKTSDQKMRLHATKVELRN